MTVFLVVELTKSASLQTMFQSFRRLLYHWHDVWSAERKFRPLPQPDDRLLELLPPGKRLSANSLEAYATDLFKV